MPLVIDPSQPSCSFKPGVGALAHIVGGGVLPRPQNPDPSSDLKSNFLYPDFSSHFAAL